MMRNRLLLAVVAVATGLFAAGCSGSGTSQTTSLSGGGVNFGATQQDIGIPFRIFSSALSQSAIAEKRLVTVRDADTWNLLWAEHAGTTLSYRPAPAVDFSKNMVVGVFLGSRSACDAVAITAVKQKQDSPRVEVSYKETTPPSDAVCIASLANPAVLAVLPRSSLSVDFVRDTGRPASELVIRSGWSFGLCVDNCEGAAEIARDGASLRVSGRIDPVLPESAIWNPVSSEEWETLTASAVTLPDVTIGCPGCADEGREWIEVQQGESRKRLTISCNAVLPEAARFQSAVRTIRSRLAVALGLPEICNPGAIAFERLAPAVFTSDIADKRFVAVRDAAAWAALWTQHAGPRAPLPPIDFSQKMVLGVFMGRESIPCGSTSIESVRQRANPDRIEVGYRVLDPGPNVMCIAAVINQYALVTVPASPLPVEFVKLP
jgi:hypothetical protein